MFIQGGIIRFVVAGTVGLLQQIMPGAGKAIASYSAIVGGLVGCLPRASESDNDVARLDPVIGDQFVLRPAGRHGSINRDGPDDIPYVRGLSAQVLNTHPEALQFVEEFLGAINNNLQYLPGYILLIPVDRRRKQ